MNGYADMKCSYIFLILIMALGFWGCSPSSALIDESQEQSEWVVNYSVIYYIHGDADYLYHTPDGNRIRGNSKVLSTAIEVGEAAKSGEVLILFKRSEKKRFGIFPRKNSRLIHYSNGEKINEVKYRHSKKNEAFLSTEQKLIEQYRLQNRANNHKSYVLFFGHELPTETKARYHRTLPQIEVNTTSFSEGIEKFLITEQERFDLVVLSTCNNGTPSTAELLMPFTETLLASPQDLHLSHIDSNNLKILETQPNISSIQLARTLAEETYNRLRETIHTTITLAVYNLGTVQNYIDRLTSITQTDKVPGSYQQIRGNIDCFENFSSNALNFRKGVDVWYKPARFGMQSNRETHSGWGCKPT